MVGFHLWRTSGVLLMTLTNLDEFTQRLVSEPEHRAQRQRFDLVFADDVFQLRHPVGAAFLIPLDRVRVLFDRTRVSVDRLRSG